MAGEEIYTTKKYLLDHVLYEMQMYLYTYFRLHDSHDAQFIKDKLLFNTFWNSHTIALRNLMSFFGICGSAKKDEIVYNSFSFAENPPNRKNRQSYYSPLSKAINHITVDRFLGYNGKNLDEIVIKARENLFPEIQQYIRLFVHHLDECSGITYTYGENSIVDISKELEDDKIKRMIAVVKQFDSLCSTEHKPERE